jgi:ankyrin repeat protein
MGKKHRRLGCVPKNQQSHQSPLYFSSQLCLRLFSVISFKKTECVEINDLCFMYVSQSPPTRMWTPRKRARARSSASRAHHECTSLTLFIAAQQGNIDACVLLLDQAGAREGGGGTAHSPDTHGRTPLWIAAKCGHVEVCALLLDRGATHAPDNDGNTPLFAASRCGHLEVCALLLNRGAIHAPNACGRTPLAIAAQERHASVCALLLDKGAAHTPDNEGRTPLFVASWFGSDAACALLLNRGADHTPDKYGRSPLHIAAQSGRVDCCILLLLNGATHVPDTLSSQTPLHAAACALNYHKEVCVVLLDNGGAAHEPEKPGAMIRTPDKYGDTPLHLAIRTGTMPIRGRTCSSPFNIDTCRLLLDKGADVDAHNSAGCTPLSIAARKGSIEFCRLLLDRGATHKPDTAGRTPLYYAAYMGHAEVCVLLLERGATHAPDNEGVTPLVCASRCGNNKDVCTLLREWRRDNESHEKLSPGRIPNTPCVL